MEFQPPGDASGQQAKVICPTPNVDCGVLPLGSAWNPLPPDGFYPGTQDLTERSE